jgi:hypothetical protein
MMKQSTSMVLIAIVMILAAALSRVAFYPLNFSPVIAMALFGGAVIKDKKLAFALPLFAMFLSDLLFEVTNIASGFWGWGQLVGYGILALITIFGFNLKKINVLNVTGFSIASSLLFYFLSNTSVWIFDSATYAPNFTGWVNCLAAGLPFLKNGLAADLVYSALFFGGYILLEKYAFKKALA